MSDDARQVTARASSSQSLRALTGDAIGQHLLATAHDEALSALAMHLATVDPYGERAHLAMALARIGRPDTGEIASVLRHQLWCAHREAAWRTGRLDPELARGSVIVRSADYLRETKGRPTVLITPMTLALTDASWIVTHAIQTLAPSRGVILYGEDVEPGNVGIAEVDGRLAGTGLAALRRILESLSRGGIFCTYADFVYQGHEAIPVQLFGAPHPISSAFISVASRPGTMLLPCLASHGEGQGFECRFFEPILMADEGQPEDLEQRAWRSRTVAQLVASTLEMLIAEAPHQWILLPTLSYNSPQMERPPGSAGRDRGESP